MAKTASLYIRIDPQMKSDVEAIYSRYGMSITDAINVFLYQSKNVGGLPFDLRPRESIGTPRAHGTQKSMKGALKKYANPELRAQERK